MDTASATYATGVKKESKMYLGKTKYKRNRLIRKLRKKLPIFIVLAILIAVAFLQSCAIGPDYNQANEMAVDCVKCDWSK